MEIKFGQGVYKAFDGAVNFIGSPHADIKIDRNPQAEIILSSKIAEFTDAGFKKITPALSISKVNVNVLNPLVAFASSIKQAPIGLAGMELVLDHAPNEQLVGIEFNTTGDIIGWHDAKEDPTLTQEFSLGALPSDLIKAATTFEIPLTVSRSDIKWQKNISLPNIESNFDLASGFIDGVQKTLVFFAIDKLIDGALLPLIKLIDKEIKDQEVLQKVDNAFLLSAISLVESAAMENKRVLLLVHGIISSTNGAFEDLAKSADFSRLYKKYEGNVIAYDHWTLSKSTAENAAQLAKELPADVTLDIICHSRGAAVVRSLLELPKLQAVLNARGIKAGKVIFVAGACEGSPLAKKETVDRLFKVFLSAGNIVGGAVKLSNSFWISLIKLLVRGLQELPGTDSLDPDGHAIKQLADSTSTLAKEYLYIRANSDFSNTAVNLIDEATIDQIIFSNSPNDVIVPFDGAGVNNRYLNNSTLVKTALKTLGSANVPQSQVWHITFFQDATVRNDICLALGC